MEHLKSFIIMRVPWGAGTVLDVELALAENGGILWKSMILVQHLKGLIL